MSITKAIFEFTSFQCVKWHINLKITEITIFPNKAFGKSIVIPSHSNTLLVGQTGFFHAFINVRNSVIVGFQSYIPFFALPIICFSFCSTCRRTSSWYWATVPCLSNHYDIRNKRDISIILIRFIDKRKFFL